MCVCAFEHACVHIRECECVCVCVYIAAEHAKRMPKKTIHTGKEGERLTERQKEGEERDTDKTHKENYNNNNKKLGKTR